MHSWPAFLITILSMETWLAKSSCLLRRWATSKSSDGSTSSSSESSISMLVFILLNLKCADHVLSKSKSESWGCMTYWEWYQWWCSWLFLVLKSRSILLQFGFATAKHIRMKNEMRMRNFVFVYWFCIFLFWPSNRASGLALFGMMFSLQKGINCTFFHYFMFFWCPAKFFGSIFPIS